MKISRIRIKNYRSIELLEMEIADYTAIIGPNGTGKSSILYALEWFFRGTALDESDIHRSCNQAVPEEACVEVMVTFTALNRHDRERLGRYGRGDTATLTRSWSPLKGVKLFGNALVFPGFSDVREASTIGAIRAAYNKIRETHSELPAIERLEKKDVIEANLSRWESTPKNRQRLVEVSDEEANHMQGFAGTASLGECVRIVLVPASTDMDREIGATRKGSALSDLVGHLVSASAAAAADEWSSKYEGALAELTDSIRTSVESSTKLHTDRVNTLLQNLVPKAEVLLDPVIPDPVARPTPSVAMQVAMDGLSTDITRHGHGVQRAVMVSVLQSIIPDRAQVEHENTMREGESQEDYHGRIENAAGALPALLVCIEEPEVYQHPIRARAFARALTNAVRETTTQVVVATHSPYFIRPEQFPSLRRMSVVDGKSEVISATVESVAARGGYPGTGTVMKFLERNVPAAYSEGFFAEGVILVEGDTDKAIIETLADKLGYPLDHHGVSVIDLSGKGNFRLPLALHAELQIPTYVIVDSDAYGHERISGSKAGKPVEQVRKEAEEKHRVATSSLLAVVRSVNDDPNVCSYSFGGPSTSDALITVWEDALECELAKWPSFMRALEAVGGQLQSKNLAEFRSAALEADTGDIPDGLRDCLSAVADFAKARTV